MIEQYEPHLLRRIAEALERLAPPMRLNRLDQIRLRP